MNQPTQEAYDTNPAANSELIELSALKQHPRNPRNHPPEQIAELQESLLTFEQTLPILIDEENFIIAGHGIYTAHLANEATHGWCVRAVGWSDEKKEAYLIADNKLAEKSRWDRAMLSNIFSGFNELEAAPDLLAATGFSPIEVTNLTSEFSPSNNPATSKKKVTGEDVKNAAGTKPPKAPSALKCMCPACGHKFEVTGG